MGYVNFKYPESEEFNAMQFWYEMLMNKNWYDTYSKYFEGKFLLNKDRLISELNSYIGDS